MKLTFSAPSKTFLVGEYSVLRGGPCLLMASKPRFEMVVQVPGEGQIEGIHMSSPAGRWVRMHNADFQGVHCQFKDPHGGKGGFGASSAQFLFSYLWTQFQHGSQSSLLERVSPLEMREGFLSLYKGEAQIPSGADLIGQWFGGLCEFRPLTSHSRSLDWKFEELDVALVRTGVKVATHNHLNDLDGKDLMRLVNLSEQTLKEFISSNEEGFLESIIEFQNNLSERGLTLLSTQRTLAKLMSLSSVQAVKGCGAMGADVIAIFYDKSQKQSLLESLQKWGLEVVVSEFQNAPGVQLSIEVPPQLSVIEKAIV